MDKKPKVVVVGLDGGTWEQLKPLMNDGVMPHLVSLTENGVSGILHSTLPPWTPTAWSSFATGKNPGKHGVFGFTRRNPDGSKAWVSSRSIRASTLWRILSSQGWRVGLLNVPLTYPPEEVNGFVVSGFPTPASAADITYPKDLLAELEAAIGSYMVSPRLDDAFLTSKTEENDVGDQLRELKEMTRTRGEALFWLMDNHPTDFLMVVFVAPDRIQHAFWKWLDPSCPEYALPEARKARKTVEEIYRMIDELIGRLQQRLDENGSLFVVSDHGFGPQNKLFLTNKWLSQIGLLRYERGKRLLRAACEKAKLYDNRLLNKVAPGLARLRNDRCINRGKTLAYGSRVDESGIYFSSPNGSSHPTLAQETIDRLKAVKDPDTGEPVVEDVVRREDVLTGPFVQQAPDLLIRWSRGYYGVNFDSIHHHSWVLPVGTANGDHREDGIFAGWGKSIRKGAHTDGSIVDMAPTILHALGLAVPDDMDGRTLIEIFTEDHNSQNLVTYSEGSASESTEQDDVYSAEDAAEIQKRLEALGYVE